MIIRKMTCNEDILGKAYVHYKSWRETYTGMVDRSYLDSMSLEKYEEIAYRYTDNIFVSEEDGTITGFVKYGPYRGDDLEGHGEIQAIYVLSRYHGSTAGYELMNRAFEELSGYDRIAVWVLKDNRRAIDFYSRYGFSPDGKEEIITLGTEITEIRMIYDRNKNTV